MAVPRFQCPLCLHVFVAAGAAEADRPPCPNCGELAAPAGDGPPPEDLQSTVVGFSPPRELLAAAGKKEQAEEEEMQTAVGFIPPELLAAAGRRLGAVPLDPPPGDEDPTRAVNIPPPDVLARVGQEMTQGAPMQNPARTARPHGPSAAPAGLDFQDDAPTRAVSLPPPEVLAMASQEMARAAEAQKVRGSSAPNLMPVSSGWSDMPFSAPAASSSGDAFDDGPTRAVNLPNPEVLAMASQEMARAAEAQKARSRVNPLPETTPPPVLRGSPLPGWDGAMGVGGSGGAAELPPDPALLGGFSFPEPPAPAAPPSNGEERVLDRGEFNDEEFASLLKGGVPTVQEAQSALDSPGEGFVVVPQGMPPPLKNPAPASPPPLRPPPIKPAMTKAAASAAPAAPAAPAEREKPGPDPAKLLAGLSPVPSASALGPMPRLSDGLSMGRMFGIALLGLAIGVGAGIALAPPPPAPPSTGPEGAKAKLTEARRLIHLGQDSVAVGLLETAIVMDPNLADAQRDLGVLYARQGRNDDAARAYEQYLSLQPKAPDFATVQNTINRFRGVKKER